MGMLCFFSLLEIFNPSSAALIFKAGNMVILAAGERFLGMSTNKNNYKIEIEKNHIGDQIFFVCGHILYILVASYFEIELNYEAGFVGLHYNLCLFLYPLFLSNLKQIRLKIKIG